MCNCKCVCVCVCVVLCKCVYVCVFVKYNGYVKDAAYFSNKKIFIYACNSCTEHVSLG